MEHSRTGIADLWRIQPGVCDDVNVADDETPPGDAPATQPALAARKRPMEREHRRTVLRVILVTHLVLALLTGVGVSVAYQQLNGNIETLPGIPDGVDRPDAIEVEGPKQPINILIMGSDTRDCEGCAIDGEAGSEGSDTTILLHISADRKDAYGVSLPRDALVTRPDCMLPDGEEVPGEELAMFNEAFTLGGALCTTQMFEALTDVRVDHQVVVDFNGFKDMVDAVNGVEVCLPKDVDDPEHNIFFDAGTQTLTGQQALNYVRERSVLSVTGDIGRMTRQQAFIASMINKVVSAGTLSRPDRVFSFLDAATSSLKLDKELANLPALVDLAMQFKNTGLDDIRFITVPFAEYEPDPNRLVWTEDADKLWERIRNDRRLGRDFSEESIKADDPVGTASGSPSTALPSDGSSATPEETAAAQEAAAARLAAGLCA
ncbi:transcriptional attenuator, LytR family [Nocardioides psychrotolerans]|uniref:Transcriptional attenuator, LytR family n=1 Tax=Nocardioides psychrotolerans TaxID=1005945 RepID=A0A1I3CS27_9ACTN|nr:transcriptional attenuator, LytR family [Nocardioides psychrotolerans]